MKELLQSEISRLNGGMLAKLFAAWAESESRERAQQRTNQVNWAALSLHRVRQYCMRNNITEAEIAAADIPALEAAAAAKKAAAAARRR